MHTAPTGTGGWTVPGYGELGEIGSGATGRVVAAVHQASEQRVAIKYLATSLVGDAGFVQRFRTEARLLAALHDPNVVGFHEYVEGPGAAAIVMELVDGVSLRALLDRLGPTTPEAALVVLRGSLRGLGAAHRVGVVHRDYKPDNILVQGDGRSRLTDFGVAIAAGQQARAAGTPAYMAPEQWRGTVGPQADVYAATVVFFECLTGHLPYGGTTLPQLAAAHAMAPVPVDQVPEPLRILVQDGLAKDPMDRPMTADLFAERLETIAERQYGRDWERRGLLALAAGVAALAPALAGGGAGGASASGSTSFASTNLGMATIGATALAIVAAGVFAAVQITASAKPAAAHHPALPRPVVAVSSQSAPPSDAPTPTPTPTYGHPTPTASGTGSGGKTGPTKIAVPDVAGMDSTSALSLLHQKGLSTEVHQVYDDTAAKGTVVRTDPAAGTLVDSGNLIKVYVSLGKQVTTVTVPELTGLQVDDAVARLHALGLKTAVVHQTNTDLAPGKVISSDPAGGSTANVGDTVTLTVAQAPTSPPPPPPARGGTQTPAPPQIY